MPHLIQAARAAQQRAARAAAVAGPQHPRTCLLLAAAALAAAAAWEAGHHVTDLHPHHRTPENRTMTHPLLLVVDDAAHTVATNPKARALLSELALTGRRNGDRLKVTGRTITVRQRP